MSEEKELTFEEALQELEKVVHELEKEEVPLEKLIDYYQRGMELVKLSNQQLQEAESKIAKVINDEGKLEPFTIEEE